MNGARRLTQARRESFVLAIVAGIACLAGGYRNPVQFFHSYLFGYMAWLGVAIGCLTFWLLGNLVGGAWSRATQPVLQAGSMTIPALAVFFLPILFNLKRIYPWMDAVVAHQGLSAHQYAYFNPYFFGARAVLYFAIWCILAMTLHERTSRRFLPVPRSRGLGAAGLILVVISLTWAMIDWIMSLEPHWSSSIYGALLLIGDALSALAFTIILVNWRRRLDAPGSDLAEDTIHDLGKLLLAFTILWTYMALSQFLIIWSANLPEEIGWYIVRKQGGWLAVAVFIILFLFAVPFLLLLSRPRKKDFSRLVRVAALIFGVRIVELYWLIAPDFSPTRCSIHPLDIAMPLALGGLWMAHFLGRLQKVDAR
ncbi:MAG TPA: hypothetical protein VMU17_06840 [Elusimicrobiota bacterium]|nr:hypothetical protein [Elusimicrobiota bacterium]